MAYTTEEILERLIGFDTVSSKSNLELIDWARDLLEQYGAKCTYYHNPEKTKANLYACLGPEDVAGVVFSGHTDVVPIDGQDWLADPFAVRKENGYYIGRGTCDMKGFLAVCLAKLPEIDVKALKRPLQFAMSFDEETGCTGVLHMIEGIKDKVAPNTIVIVGEPTSMKIVSGHKGGSHFRTEVRGFEAHSSLTHMGVSAIHYGGRLIAKLDDLAREYAANPQVDSGYEPAHATISIGLANGGTAGNIIARQFVIDWEIRWIAAKDVGDIEKRFNEYADELQREMQTKVPETWIKTTQASDVPMFAKDLDGPAEQFMRRLTGSNDVNVVSYQTEAGHFQNVGMSVVICGPGSIEQAHKPEEFVAIEQLQICEDLISRIIADCSR